MNSKKITFCFIEEFPSLKEGIFRLTGVSKSKLKQFGINKNYLDKKILKKDLVSLPLNLLNQGQINPIYTGSEIKILFENEDILVLSKPENIHIHPLSYDESDNLLSFIRSYKSELLEVNKDSYDRGLLYRLDYETSGAVYYIKKQVLFDTLRTHFSEQVKTKKYLAVVEGKIPEQGLLENHLKLSGAKGSKVIIDSAGKYCNLSYKRIEWNPEKDYSLVEVFLNQGFRHQIRVQLKEAGFPIIGDPLYGTRDADRMYLHCQQYLITINNSLYEIEDNTFNLELLF